MTHHVARIVGAYLLLAMLSTSAVAGPFVIAGPTWSQSTSDAFWFNVSYDGNGYANVGVFLTAAPGSDVPGFYDASPYLTDLAWLGDGTTTFFWDVDATYEALFGVTAWQDQFYMVNGALFFQSPYALWRSDQLDNGRSHFAVFDSPSFYYVGMEDATFSTAPTADWDYNDLIIALPKPVPDTGSTLLLFGVLLPVWVAYGAYRGWKANKGGA